MTPVANLLEAKRALHASEKSECNGDYREAVMLALHAIKHLHAWAVEIEREDMRGAKHG